MKFPQLLLYKSKLLTDLAQILKGIFYIILVYVYETMNNQVIKKLLIPNHWIESHHTF